MTLEAMLLTLTWLLPLASGLLQLARPKALLPLVGWAALPGLVTAVFLPIGSSVEFSWLLLGSQFILDETAQPFLLFTALLWLAAGLFAASYLQNDARRPRFFAFYLLAMAGNFGLILTGDMTGYYLWFALMSFASYGLVVHTGDAEARYAGRVYIILVVVGEVILFAGLAQIYIASGTLLFSELAGQPLSHLSAALIFISFGIKAGVVALHLWLPLAHPAAPIPASAVLSGAMIKAGLLGWLRFLHPAGTPPEWGGWIILLGLVTAFYGAALGVSQTNPKTVLAYSSISQMGFIMVGVGGWLLTGQASVAMVTAVFLYATHHALAKGALFLGVAFAGNGRAVPALLLLPALALAGLPFTSGAVAKTALKTAVETLPGNWKMLLELPLSLAAVGTTLLMARFLWLIWRSAAAKKTPARALWGVWLALLGAVALLLFILPLAAPAVQDSLKPEKWWTAVWPILAGVGLAVGAARLWRGPALPLVPPGDLVVPLAWTGRQLQGYLGTGLHYLARLQDGMIANLAAVRALLAAVIERLVRWELRLRTDWIVPGTLFLILTTGILVLVWWGF